MKQVAPAEGLHTIARVQLLLMGDRQAVGFSFENSLGASRGSDQRHLFDGKLAFKARAQGVGDSSFR